MPLIPRRFLFRVLYCCPYVPNIPREKGDRLLDLPETCRLDNMAAMDEAKNFADVRLGWNELGLGVQVDLQGKEQLPVGDVSRPRASDGITLWVDTRDARTSHRASRYCHQFHLLPTGGGPERDEPALLQTKMNRALQDAPLCLPNAAPFRCNRQGKGYLAEVFLPGSILNGFDPEQNPRLGFYYAVRDVELGEQVLSVGADFPYWEDPTLWGILELAK